MLIILAYTISSFLKVPANVSSLQRLLDRRENYNAESDAWYGWSMYHIESLLRTNKFLVEREENVFALKQFSQARHFRLKWSWFELNCAVLHWILRKELVHPFHDLPPAHGFWNWKILAQITSSNTTKIYEVHFGSGVWRLRERTQPHCFWKVQASNI